MSSAIESGHSKQTARHPPAGYPFTDVDEQASFRFNLTPVG